MAGEVGSLSEARRMPREVRMWWLGELEREAQERAETAANVARGRR